MGLKKDITTNQGEQVSYWNVYRMTMKPGGGITIEGEEQVTRHAQVHVGGYISQEWRQKNSTPVEQKAYSLSQEAIDKIIDVIYEEIKTQETFADATDVLEEGQTI